MIDLIWDPHQKLWNWRLVGKVRRLFRTVPPVGRAATWLIVTVDSLILLSRVIVKRVRAGALPQAPSASVLYIDCGLHQAGAELRQMDRWFGDRYALSLIGFEAGSSQVEHARRALSDVDAEVRHAAVVGPSHAEPAVTFYNRGRAGIGDSLFVERGGIGEETVPAVRVSDVLRGHEADAVILRMNIEGAELFVIEDLARCGLLSRISGFYGMWDDLSKNDDRVRERQFRELLRRYRMHTTTFNARDLPHALRRMAIRMSIDTDIRLAYLGRDDRTAESRTRPRT
jgi:FkbM family methyltransferase